MYFSICRTLPQPFYHFRKIVFKKFYHSQTKVVEGNVIHVCMSIAGGGHGWGKHMPSHNAKGQADPPSPSQEADPPTQPRRQAAP